MLRCKLLIHLLKYGPSRTLILPTLYYSPSAVMDKSSISMLCRNTHGHCEHFCTDAIAYYNQVYSAFVIVMERVNLLHLSHILWSKRHLTPTHWLYKKPPAHARIPIETGNYQYRKIYFSGKYANSASHGWIELSSLEPSESHLQIAPRRQTGRAVQGAHREPNYHLPRVSMVRRCGI